MDPHNPASFTHRTLRLSTGRTYHFVDQIPDHHHASLAKCVVLVHGFPDFWYGWRHQIGPLVRRGYRVIVPDMLGYGGTDQPDDPAEYTPRRLSADLAALLDALSISKAVFIGHDWGSLIVQRFALFHPQRIQALGILAVPYWAPARKYVPLEEIIKKDKDWGYMVFFASSRSNGIIDRNVRRFLSLLFRSGGPSVLKEGELEALLTGRAPIEPKPTPVLSEQELAYYLENFPRIGGALNYYRTTKLRYEDEKTLPASPPLTLPVLFIGGTHDPTSLPRMVEDSRRYIPQLEAEILEDGHWLMIGSEKDAVTARLGAWLGRVTGDHAKRRSLL